MILHAYPAVGQSSHMLSIIRVLMRTLTLRDPALVTHSRRVAALALDTARAAGYSEQEITDIGGGALLHDTGKLLIPDRILHKPGPLTDIEWELVRRHPDKGANLLAPWPEFAPVAQIVRAHHEWYDGGGYPYGLRRTAIPAGARVVAVVDAYIAMIEQRVYHSPREPAAALAELQRCAGSQFDPEIVTVFCAMIE